MLVQRGRQLFGLLAGAGVDDRGAGVGLLQQLQCEVRSLWLREFDDLDGEVVATEAGDEDGRVLEVELDGDVALDGWRCCRGERDDWSWAKGWKVLAERSVVGAKVVSPGGDAMSFVDCDEDRFALGEHLGEAGDAHAFGSDE